MTQRKWIKKTESNNEHKSNQEHIYNQLNINDGYYNQKNHFYTNKRYNNTNYQQYNNNRYGNQINKYSTKIFVNYKLHCNSNDINVLRVLSWNLNVTEKVSKCAPEKWSINDDKWKLAYLQIIKQKPDIIALQELPINAEKRKTFLQYFINTNQWYLTDQFETKHRINICGTVMLIHKNLFKYFDIKYNGNNNKIDNLYKWPGVILCDKRTKKCKLLLYCIHFYPTKQCYKERREEFNELYMESIKNNLSDRFVCVGDTNMRENEEETIKRDYNLKSCWDIIPNRFKRNDYYTWHWCYFDAESDYSLRYDRMFMSKKIQCKCINIFDEVVSKNKRHFISDHRGVVVTIKI